MKTVKSKTKTSLLSSFIDEARENISEGSKIIEKKTAEAVEVVKDKTSRAYKAGAEVIENATTKVQQYSDYQKTLKDLKHLRSEKESLLVDLGQVLIDEYTKNGTLAKKFLDKKLIQNIIKDIQLIDERIARINDFLSHK